MTGITRTVLSLLVLSIVGSTALAGDLTNLRVSNYDGTSRIVLDVTELPLSWTKSYHSDSHTVTLNLANITNKVTTSIGKQVSKDGVLKDVSIFPAKGGVQVKLGASKAVNFHAFSLSNPDRIVVDMFSDYSQKTTKNISDSIGVTKIKTTVPEGVIKAISLIVSNESPMMVMHDEDGLTLASVTEKHIAAIGLTEKGKDFNKLYSVSRSGDMDIDKIASVGVLRYTPSRGYFVEEKAPLLQVKAGKEQMIISSVNRPRRKDSLALYTPRFGKSTETNQYGYEVTVTGGKVTSISNGDSPLEVGSYVLSAHGEAIKSLQSLKLGMTVSLQSREALAKVDTDGGSVFEGGQLVLRNGSYVGPLSSTNEGRTFIGSTKDEKLIVAAIDKKEPQSVGVTLEEGAELLKSLGAVNGFELSNQGRVDMTVKDEPIDKNGQNNTVYESILLVK